MSSGDGGTAGAPGTAGLPISLKNLPIRDVLITSITAGSRPGLRHACLASPET